MEEKKLFPSEAALLIGLIINSFGIRLMVESGLGLSPISTLPYVFSLSLPFLSFGTWNYTFQSTMIISLMILRRKFSPGYLLAFVIGICFGHLIDFFGLFLPMLPHHFLLDIFYFSAGFLIISTGLCLMVNCMLPIIPTDIFPRDFAIHFHFPYQVVKTCFDLSCFSVTIFVSLICLHKVVGIGIGTVICSFFTGKMIAVINGYVSRRFYFTPVFSFFKKLATVPVQQPAVSKQTEPADVQGQSQ